MSDKTVAQLAADLLANGLNEFIGDGLTVEIATKQIGRHLEYGGWREHKIVRPKPSPAPPSAIDYGIGLPGQPGSAERINGLQTAYATAVNQLEQLRAESVRTNKQIDPDTLPSAFSLTLEQMADKLAGIGLDYDTNAAGDIVAVKRTTRSDMPTQKFSTIRSEWAD